jgi:hypothetical protein
MVPTRKEPLFKAAVSHSILALLMDSPRRKKNATLRTVTVVINEKVVQAVGQFLSAETLYRKRCVPMKTRATMLKTYQLDMRFNLKTQKNPRWTPDAHWGFYTHPF